MEKQPPNTPSGVADLNSQPGLESDGGLHALQEILKTDLPEDVFNRLTQYVPDDKVPAKPTENYRERALDYVVECLSYREALRPDSLREQGEIPDGISRTTAGSWVWYFSGDDDIEHNVAESEADTFEHGKYLFFTPNVARVLEDIVIQEFRERPFRSAKIPTIPAKREDWVLCLYEDDNRYCSLFREEYNHPPTVRFRGFKTDAATRRGEYSDRFEDSS